MLKFSKFGDWTKAGKVLQGLQVNLCPAFKAQLKEDGDLILSTIQGHIDKQDLGWVPLSSKTIEIKRGNSTIYVDTGYLRDNLEVRRVKSPKDGLTLFIGASAWKRTPSGVKFSDLMIWLEYGTDKMTPRPLIQPTFEEVQDIIKDNWEECFKKLCKGG